MSLLSLRFRLFAVLSALTLTVSCGGAGGGTVAAKSVAVKLFASVGDDTRSLEKIFHRSPTNPLSQKEFSDARGAFKQATSNGFEIFAGTSRPTTIAAQVLETINQTASGLVVLVGHNENGSIYFRDGSGVAITSIQNPPGGFTAILSCSSLVGMQDALGIPTELSYTIAFDTGRRFQSALRARGNLDGLTRQAAQDLLTSSFNSAKQARGTKLVVLGASGAGAVTVIAVVKS